MRENYVGELEGVMKEVNVGCPFCTELRTGEFPDEYDIDIHSRILHETEHFLVMSDLSPLAPGHLLIIPREHLLSFGSVPTEQRVELERFISKIAGVLSEHYSPPTIMEHGSSSRSHGGKTVSHAHLQVFPGDIDIREALSRFRLVRISAFWDIADWSSRDEAYSFFWSLNGDMFVADGIEGIIPQQFFRIEIAKAIGLPGDLWDWRKTILREHLETTVETLRDVWQ